MHDCAKRTPSVLGASAGSSRRNAGKCRKRGVDGRLKPQGLDNAGLEVVGIALVTLPKKLSARRPDLAPPDRSPGGAAGGVGLHRRTGGVAIAEGGAGALFERGEALAKPRVSVTVGVPLATATEASARQRHALSLQLAGDLAPVGLVQVLGRAAATLESAALQNVIIVQAKRQRPARQSGLTRPQQVGRNGRLADLQPLRYRTNRKPCSCVSRNIDRMSFTSVSLSELVPITA